MNKLSVDSEVKLNLWMLQEVSARRIQKHFRTWYCWRLTLRHSRRRARLVGQLSADTAPSLMNSFQRIVNEEASFEDRMAFWRGAVELRKAHREPSSDLVVKAMIESGADLSRAIVLFGTKSFIEKNSNDLPAKLRDLFALRHDNNDRGRMYGGAAVGMTRLGTVKLLKNRQRDERRSELISLVDSVARRACFSKSHHGHRLHKQLQRTEDETTCAIESKPCIKQMVDRFSSIG